MINIKNNNVNNGILGLQALGELTGNVKEDNEAPGERGQKLGLAGKAKFQSSIAAEKRPKANKSKPEATPLPDVKLSLSTGKGGKLQVLTFEKCPVHSDLM
jgi:hypothetical protein